MRVMGIDPGLQNMGFGVIDVDGHPDPPCGERRDP
jgi:Holliday junction resolvasome RuvABC endonuclease subunit